MTESWIKETQITWARYRARLYRRWIERKVQELREG